MIGIIVSVIAGAAMSIQGVMNTRLGEGIGPMYANAIVQGTAFVLSVVVVLMSKEGGFSCLGQVNRLYLFGGVLGIIITLTVMSGIKSLGPAVAISVILISQLLVAAGIDAFGLMDSEKVPFTWTKIWGLVLMICGVLLFKYTKK